MPILRHVLPWDGGDHDGVPRPWASRMPGASSIPQPMNHPRMWPMRAGASWRWPGRLETFRHYEPSGVDNAIAGHLAWAARPMP